MWGSHFPPHYTEIISGPSPSPPISVCSPGQMAYSITFSPRKKVNKITIAFDWFPDPTPCLGFDKVLGFDEELVGHVTKKGVDPAPQGAGHGPRPGHAVWVAQGQGEKLSSIGRQVEDHRGSEVVGEHHANLVDERAGDDQVPAAVRVAEELLERRMAERVLLRRLDCLPALGDAREKGPERAVCLHRVGDKVVLEDAELGVVHHQLVDSLWKVRLMVAGDEGDLH